MRSKFTKDEYERSDLVYCPVKAYARLHDVPMDVSMRTVASWVIGESLHMIMQQAFKITELKQQIMPNVNVRWDVLWDKFTEIKTTTLPMFRPSHLLPNYLRQLEFGLAFMDKSESYLISLDIINKVLLVWDVKFKRSYLDRKREDYKAGFEILQEANRLNNPLMLTPRTEECPWCPWFERCPYLKSYR